MKTRRNFLKLAGAAMVSVTGVASASENPFGLTKMKSGYTQVAMEGNCGGNMKKEAMEKKDDMEGKCGGNMKKEAMEKKSDMEGKCGEGKCGGKMKEEAMEKKEMKSSKEGSCGGWSKKEQMEGKCGGQKL
ncbi:HvfA family oxazolone/thioamide-modified RiPP metallophore [Thiomicrorhabdus arctica]|uniref:HvfA family oxazolone/thioamide-modified RiPP metallophore n=1 Tax=Thiomicrorhabdus arctica TaxID=131540 RepID=UPI000380186E|nr:twin-arginine translocation signal domain-containing protein [Thiomicrorhabdus arctica]